MIFVEGSAVKDKFGNIFYVSYYNDKFEELYVIPKYYKKGNTYVKINSKEELNEFLKKLNYKLLCYSKYLRRKTFILPLELIEIYYDPIARLKEILWNAKDEHERKVIRIIEEIKIEGFKDVENFGIEGSVLVSLHNKNSDIDLVYYGDFKEELYNVLISLREKGKTNPLGDSMLKRLYYEREFQKYMSYNLFKQLEQRKVCEGKFLNTQYSIKMINRLLYEEVKANKYFSDTIEVINAKNSYLFPSIYKVKSLKDGSEYDVINFRIRYMELLKEGEKAKIKGLLELNENSKRLILIEKNSYIRPILSII